MTAIAAPGSIQGSRTGFVELTRGTDRRRIPYWLRVSAPALAAAQTTPLTARARTRATREGARRSSTRTAPGGSSRLRRTARRCRAGAGVPGLAAESGRELRRRGHGRAPDVQPRVVRAGDENRLLGRSRSPTTRIRTRPASAGRARRRAGAPGPGDYDIVFDTLGASRAGPFTFRFWIGDTSRPAAVPVARAASSGSPRATTAPGSIRAGFGSRRRTPPVGASTAPRVLVRTARARRGRHTLTVDVSDDQDPRTWRMCAGSCEHRGGSVPRSARASFGPERSFVVGSWARSRSCSLRTRCCRLLEGLTTCSGPTPTVPLLRRSCQPTRASSRGHRRHEDSDGEAVQQSRSQPTARTAPMLRGTLQLGGRGLATELLLFGARGFLRGSEADD